MNFGEALEFMKKGDVVRRDCWDCKKEVYLEKGIDLQNSLEYGYGEYENEPTISSSIVMLENNNIILGWQPNSQDMLASDWSIKSSSVDNIMKENDVIRIMKNDYFCNIKLYKEIYRDIEYIITITLNDAVNNILYIIDPNTKEIVGESHITIGSINILSDILLNLVSIYLCSSTLVIERNDFGLILITNLIDSSICHNLYKENGIYGFPVTKKMVAYMEKILSGVIKIPLSINSPYLKIMEDLILFEKGTYDLRSLHYLKTFLIGICTLDASYTDNK